MSVITSSAGCQRSPQRNRWKKKYIRVHKNIETKNCLSIKSGNEEYIIKEINIKKEPTNLETNKHKVE